jgi:phosphoribosylformimino-5-aminoimidazole carboxamide ribonucleotide (ProFAR) isomerase
MIPCLLLKAGQVCLPGPEGPVPARTPSGARFDPFDVVDRLLPEYSLLYVVDLDGIDRADAQLDYLQEISRDISLWVDAGVRTADQAIDVLVAGARRAVLSSAYLRGPRQLSRAWKLSTEFVFEIEMVGGRLSPAPVDWGTEDPAELARTVRSAGPDHVVVSPRETDVDWSVVRTIARQGPTWVDGSFTRQDEPLLREAGASGGIFHLDDLLAHWEG